MMLNPLLPLIYEPLVRAALLEDLGRAGDITADAIVPADQQAKLVMRARQPGVIAGLDVARCVFQTVSPAIGLRAERPDGSRGRFIPYPTPLFDAAGQLCGAVNLLVDVTAQPKPAFFEAQAEQCRRLATTVDDPHTAEMLALMAAKYYEQSRQDPD